MLDALTELFYPPPGQCGAQMPEVTAAQAKATLATAGASEIGGVHRWQKYLFDVVACDQDKRVPLDVAKVKHGVVKIDETRVLLSGGSFGKGGGQMSVQTNIPLYDATYHEGPRVYMNVYWPESYGEKIAPDARVDASFSTDPMGKNPMNNDRPLSIHLRDPAYSVGGYYIIPVRLEWNAARFLSPQE